MKKKLALAFVVVLKLFFESDLYACSCADRGDTPEELYEKHSLVFVGKTLEEKQVKGAEEIIIDEDGEEIIFDPKDEFDYLLEIREVYKGDASSYVVFKSLESCEFKLIKGQTYLFYTFVTKKLFIEYDACTVIYPVNSSDYDKDLEWIKSKIKGSKSFIGKFHSYDMSKKLRSEKV